jgi:hypothetical protein
MTNKIAHTKYGPRPPTARALRVGVKLTESERVELERIARLEGVTVSSLLRRGIVSPSNVSTLDANGTRRSA